MAGGREAKDGSCSGGDGNSREMGYKSETVEDKRSGECSDMNMELSKSI